MINLRKYVQEFYSENIAELKYIKMNGKIYCTHESKTILKMSVLPKQRYRFKTLGTDKFHEAFVEMKLWVVSSLIGIQKYLVSIYYVAGLRYSH